MDIEQENLNRLIRSLKQKTPTLIEPNHLTNSIMDQIGKATTKRAPLFLICARAALSTAAAALIGIFIFQQSEAENRTTTTSYKPIQEETIEVNATCMQQLGSEHLNILKTYLCYMQQNAIENQRFTTHPKQKNANQ